VQQEAVIPQRVSFNWDDRLKGIRLMGQLSEADILSDTFQCHFANNGLMAETWILSTAWETLTLCLAVWIASKRFRELPRNSGGWITKDCFAVLIQTHVHYFAV
jgi:hypothetical protein